MPVAMPAAARLYVAVPCLGDFGRCERVADELVAVVQAINRPAPAISYLIRTLSGEVGLAEERLNPDRVLAATGGRYTFLFVNLTFDPGRVGEPELAEIETRFGLRQFDSASSPVDIFNLDTR